jgi:hypothetical protein
MEAELACCSPGAVPLEGKQGCSGKSPFDRYRPAEDLMANSQVALQIVLAEEEQYGGNPKQRQTGGSNGFSNSTL